MIATLLKLVCRIDIDISDGVCKLKYMWMVRICAQLVDPIQRQKTVHMSFGRVVCWLLDAHFIVGTACMVQQYIFAVFYL